MRSVLANVSTSPLGCRDRNLAAVRPRSRWPISPPKCSETARNKRDSKEYVDYSVGYEVSQRIAYPMRPPAAFLAGRSAGRLSSANCTLDTATKVVSHGH
jgi:hypothetical protein